MTAFTLFHVALSLIGILSGIPVVMGLLSSDRTPVWTAIFLTTTIATSVTGFMFPFERLLPSHWVGIISLVLLAIALVALYGRDLTGRWRWIYVVCACLALYLNVFVLVAQLFMKVPALRAMAPTQSEPPFAVAQIVVLILFAALTIASVKRFHPASRTG
jgi:hypothetical protein